MTRLKQMTYSIPEIHDLHYAHHSKLIMQVLVLAEVIAEFKEFIRHDFVLKRLV